MSDKKSFSVKFGWKELKNQIHTDSGIPVAQIDEVFGAAVNTTERIIKENAPKLIKGDNKSKVQIMFPTGALTFRDRNERVGFNPATKQKITIDPGVTMSYSPPKIFMVAANIHKNIGSRPHSDPVKVA